MWELGHDPAFLETHNDAWLRDSIFTVYGPSTGFVVHVMIFDEDNNVIATSETVLEGPIKGKGWGDSSSKDKIYELNEPEEY
jgi:hypothetical protein